MFACKEPVRKKVSLFWPTLAGGGVERTGLRVAKELVCSGYDVDIVVASATGEFTSEIPTGANLVNLDLRLGGGRLLFTVFPLARYLCKDSPAILMSLMTEANIVAVLAKWMSGWPGWLIVSEQSTLSVRIKQRPIKRILPQLVRIFYPFANRVHAVSQGVADDLDNIINISLKGIKIEVIHNPIVDPELYDRAEEPLEHPWFATGEPPIVLGVGRLVPAKDFSTLIRAFALVRRQVVARLMILGQGDGRPSLESLVKELELEEDVALPGFVENPYKYMKRAGVFVLSSAWEGFGNVLVEAMAVGTPVVATDCPSGPSEILDKGRYGPLVPVGDHRALANAIVDVLLDNNVRSEKARQARIQRAMEFSVDRIISRYQALLFPPDAIKGEVSGASRD